MEAQSADAALARAASVYDTVKTARGSIEQTVRSALMRNPVSSKADYQQQLPDRLSLRFSDPRGDILVSDGAAVWLYQPSVDPRVVRKTPLSSVRSWVNLMSVLVNDTRSRFNISDGGSETLLGQRMRVAVLVPKEPNPGMLRLKVWIEEQTGVVRQFEVQESADLTRTIRFVTLQLNVPVEAARFRYSPPAGVRVEEIGG
jgi:outer membrane lipoprotein carrier protein